MGGKTLIHLDIITLFMVVLAGFLRCFWDPIRVPRIENRVPRIRENRVSRIREIGSLGVHTGYLTFSFKKNNWF